MRLRGGVQRHGVLRDAALGAVVGRGERVGRGELGGQAVLWGGRVLCGGVRLGHGVRCVSGLLVTLGDGNKREKSGKMSVEVQEKQEQTIFYSSTGGSFSNDVFPK